MFHHVMIGANDVEESKRFYDAVLGTLGHPGGTPDPKGRYFYVSNGNILALTKPIDGQTASHANGGTIGFNAASPDEVEAWHAAGLANGGTPCEDPPGKRANGMYVAYLRDPAGNKVCAVHR